MIRRLGSAIALALTISVPALAHDGDLDRSFGIGGKVFQTLPGGAFIGSYAAAIGMQSSGQFIVAASKVISATNQDFAALRINADGSIDASFGTGGAAVVAFDRSGSGLDDRLASIAVQADDKIVLAGFVEGDATTSLDMGVVRLNGDGSRDLAFGVNGKTTVAFNLGTQGVGSAFTDTAERVNLQADGQILLVGQANTTTNAATPKAVMAVVRLNGSNGQRDGTFDVDGRVTLSFGGDLARGMQIRQLADQAHILVVGGAYTMPGVSNADFALAKLDAHGALDPSFGVGGKATFAFDVGGGNSDIAYDFIELPDGALFVCGIVTVSAPGNSDFGCMRFLANGTPDPAFAPVLIPFDRGGDFADAALRMAPDALGRLVVVGYATGVTGNLDFAVARVMSDGTLDMSFGLGGTTTFSSVRNVPQAPPDRDNAATGVLIQPDGKIVVAGLADSDGSGDYQIELVRVIGDSIFADGFGP